MHQSAQQRPQKTTQVDDDRIIIIVKEKNITCNQVKSRKQEYHRQDLQSRDVSTGAGASHIISQTFLQSPDPNKVSHLLNTNSTQEDSQQNQKLKHLTFIISYHDHFY